MRGSLLVFLLIPIVLTYQVEIRPRKGLTLNFYRHTCPRAENIVMNIISKRVATDKRLPAKLLRLQFHDCFVRGCDASVLLESTAADSPAEIEAVPSRSLAGLDAVAEVKSNLEKECPGVVSCADIIALAARDSVSHQFGRQIWPVLTGRRDGLISNATDVLTSIPSPSSNFTHLKQSFAKKGLTVEDLVVLSGAHTIGVGHCKLFSKRLYNFTGKGDQDPSLSPKYAAFLKSKCRSLADNTTTVPMDPLSPFSIRNNYYKILKERKGLFTSDATLLTNRHSALIVDKLLDSDVFFSKFGESIMKLGAIGVLTGRDGQIRKNCGMVNL